MTKNYQPAYILMLKTILRKILLAMQSEPLKMKIKELLEVSTL